MKSETNNISPQTTQHECMIFEPSQTGIGIDKPASFTIFNHLSLHPRTLPWKYMLIVNFDVRLDLIAYVYTQGLHLEICRGDGHRVCKKTLAVC